MGENKTNRSLCPPWWTKCSKLSSKTIPWPTPPPYLFIILSPSFRSTVPFSSVSLREKGTELLPFSLSYFVRGFTYSFNNFLVFCCWSLNIISIIWFSSIPRTFPSRILLTWSSSFNTARHVSLSLTRVFNSLPAENSSKFHLGFAVSVGLKTWRVCIIAFQFVAASGWE